MREGDDLEAALQQGFEELDGFYTFLIGTRDKLALVRDAFACKPAIVAETDDYVAIASEFRSLAHLPGVNNAKLFEPMPEELYVWKSLAAQRPRAARRRPSTSRTARCASSTSSCTASCPAAASTHVDVLNPDGAHSIAVGVDAPVRIDVRGHAGYYLGGMNKLADLTVHGNVGWGVAENMMSGTVRVKGFASEAAGASGHGGLLVIEGDASLRCGISMKGIDIVVGGSVGNFSAFMAQAGRLVVCGDAGDALGDSLYEAVIYVRGKIKSLGADARVETMTEADCRAARRRCSSGPASPTTRPSSSASRRCAACITGTPTPIRSIDHDRESTMHHSRAARARPARGERRASTAAIIDYIQHAAATAACTRSAGWAPSGACRTSTIWCSWRRRCRAIRWKAIARSATPRRCWARASPSKPVELDIPITIAGMSFGSLSANVKEALGRAATELGTSTTTGDGGMTQEERRSSKTLVYQCLPSRYGFNPDDLRQADAIEVVIGQGAKPGGGGMLLGQKISPRVAEMRTLPAGIDQRSACRHPDWTGPDDLVIKINELREITDWQVPIYVKIGATRTFNDVKLAVHAGADVVVVDGMQGGTAATQTVFIEHVGIPTLAALRQAVDALEEMDMRGKVQLIVSGGIRTGADVAKALALGADAVSIGQGVLIALGCNSETYFQDGEHHYGRCRTTRQLGAHPGTCHHCHTGRCPVGITTQDPMLEQRLEPAVGARHLKNYFKTW